MKYYIIIIYIVLIISILYLFFNKSNIDTFANIPVTSDDTIKKHLHAIINLSNIANTLVTKDKLINPGNLLVEKSITTTDLTTKKKINTTDLKASNTIEGGILKCGKVHFVSDEDNIRLLTKPNDTTSLTGMYTKKLYIDDKLIIGNMNVVETINSLQNRIETLEKTYIRNDRNYRIKSLSTPEIKEVGQPPNFNTRENNDERYLRNTDDSNWAADKDNVIGTAANGPRGIYQYMRFEEVEEQKHLYITPTPSPSPSPTPTQTSKPSPPRNF
jgi:hypothetical protein